MGAMVAFGIGPGLVPAVQATSLFSLSCAQFSAKRRM
jgi:hypothetical protein